MQVVIVPLLFWKMEPLNIYHVQMRGVLSLELVSFLILGKIVRFEVGPPIDLSLFYSYGLFIFRNWHEFLAS